MALSQGFGDVQDLTYHTTARSALDQLCVLYEKSISAIHSNFSAYLDALSLGQEESFALSQKACYPFLGVKVDPKNLLREKEFARSYGTIFSPGIYGTTITQPELLRAYYYEQLELLIKNHDVPVAVGISSTPIPLPFALNPQEFVSHSASSWLFRHVFEFPDLTSIDDSIANGAYIFSSSNNIRPLSLFTAPRVDYSLHRLKHYTGTSPEHFQRFILLTNYQRYIPPFIAFGKSLLTKEKGYSYFVEPGDRISRSSDCFEDRKGMEDLSHTLPQMPAYHLVREDGNGITFINIGVGPTNAKNITDHLAVLRPHCWIMLGHCAGFSDTQILGDYVLAHGYLREDHVLDADLPRWVPVPPIAEVQVALENAVQKTSNINPDNLKLHLRTGTVLTTDNRNWELRIKDLLTPIKQSRAIALDMESATIAANGFRFRVPYGTLLCVSDRPLHGEIKISSTAQQFYKERVDQHLQVGLETMISLREKGMQMLHSRKLRGVDDPPFR